MWITIRQGSGSYVSATPGMIDDPFGLTFVEDKQKMIKDLMEIRFLIEPSIAAMAAIRADETDIKNILTACENTEKLLLANKNHAEKDIAFHTAIALSSKNIVVPKLVPIINSSIPLIRESAKFTMRDETIEIHREIADAIAAHDARPCPRCDVSASDLQPEAYKIHKLMTVRLSPATLRCDRQYHILWFWRLK